MAQVSVKYNPYLLETTITVDGNKIPDDSGIFVPKGKRLQEWIGDFPKKLRDELNTIEFSLEYIGMDLDKDDFVESFEQAQEKGLVKISGFKYVARNNEDIEEVIKQIFEDLQTGPIDDFRDPKLIQAIENINNSVFPINVIATMSSGKSTLINALLQKKLMPAKNEACTATITEILDNDDPHFVARVFNGDDVVLEEVSDLTYDVMCRLNESEDVHRIAAKGDIPFLDAQNTALMLVDTPGPNNSQNQEHKNTTYRALNRDSQNLILYVLNGTQLSTNDDANLLRYVSEQIKAGGKEARDRFLFVINKMDQFDPENESIEKVMDAAKQYLAKYDIEDPQLFPCSAFTALNIRTLLADVDIDNLTRQQQKQLPSPAKDTLPMIDKFIDFESMHLEQYTTLAPSAQQELDYHLQKAIEFGDTKEQALVHSGIYSIESAIKAYVKKYAKTKKIKDLVETFQTILESNAVMSRAKEQIATNANAAKALQERAAVIEAKIASGEEAKSFKRRIEALNPMSTIIHEADMLKEKVGNEAGRIFRRYGDVITSRDEAKRLVNQFADESSDAFAKLSSEMDGLINREIIKTGESLLQEYQEKLLKFDESAKENELDFKTADMIKDKLKIMYENTSAWTSDDFALKTVDEYGQTTYEEETYYEKVGQEEEEIVVGSHQEKIGTKKVLVGTHKEWAGTRTVKNPKKKWWKIFTPSYIEEDVYKTVEDYKDEDVYETVLDYKTIMRDVFEERTKRTEKFSVEKRLLQIGLTAKLNRTIDEAIDAAVELAGEQIETIKKQFMNLFGVLDAMIREKYKELKQYANDQEENEARMKENQKILSWLETCEQEISNAIDM